MFQAHTPDNTMLASVDCCVENTTPDPNTKSSSAEKKVMASQVSRNTNPHLEQVLRDAQQELRQVLEKKAELTRRIGTIRQTILGLANLFCAELLKDELLEFVVPKSSSRRSGFTKACRMALMEGRRAMTSAEVCDWLRQKDPETLSRHKDPMASVTTVLNRLVAYREVQPVTLHNGRRAWLWHSDLQSQDSEREQQRSAG
jgi:hypothetical protein